MTVYIHGFHNDVMAYLLQFGWSAIHRIFVAWVVFVKAIFSCLNLKPDDGFFYLATWFTLSYNELFNKIGHGLTDIVIAWDVNLSQFCTQSIFGNNGTYIYCVLEWNWRPFTMVGACVKNFFEEFRVTTLSEKWTSAGLFTNLVLK